MYKVPCETMRFRINPDSTFLLPLLNLKTRKSLAHSFLICTTGCQNECTFTVPTVVFLLAEDTQL